jgi:PAP2 superfamily
VATTDTGSHPAPESDALTVGSPQVTGQMPGESQQQRRGITGLVRRAQLAGGGERPVRPIHWWFELILAVIGYLIYAEARTLHGDDAKAYKGLAERHGRDLYNFERAIHIDWEKGLQTNLLHYKGFMQVVGGFYGGAHFVVTIGVLMWMLFRRPQFYRFWRTVLFLLTMAAVGVFALYPAMPPRILKDSSGHTITVDTLDKIGGLWSYNHGVIERISDGYAPMPSLHLGWSTWVALALFFTLPATTWRRKLVFLYPLAVYFTVIATGTHFVIDGVAGMALTATTVLVSAWVVVHYRQRRKRRQGLAQSGDDPVPELNTAS